jgi:hypothetical protein
MVGVTMRKHYALYGGTFAGYQGHNVALICSRVNDSSSAFVHDYVAVCL